MKTSFITVSILAAILSASSLPLQAEHVNGAPHREKSANEIIGQKVMNDQNEDVGKVQDIIINVESGQAPYVIIATAGFTDRTKVAVPLDSLRCSPDGKSMVISASKEQLQAASKSASGAWMASSGSDWTKKVDAYYGQPALKERNMRDTFRTDDRIKDGDRLYVRDPAPKGAELLVTPQDMVLCQKITDKVDVLSVQVQNGVAHLYGQVENEQARQSLENQVRSVDGITKVESHLRVKNPQK